MIFNPRYNDEGFKPTKKLSSDLLGTEKTLLPSTPDDVGSKNENNMKTSDNGMPSFESLMDHAKKRVEEGKNSQQFRDIFPFRDYLPQDPLEVSFIIPTHKLCLVFHHIYTRFYLCI